MRARIAIALAVAATGLGGSSVAVAEPLSLSLTHQPPRLRMRAKKVAAAATVPVTPPPLVTAPAPIPATDVNEPASIRDLRARVAAQINLGYVVDGTTVTTPPSSTGFGTVSSDSRRDAAFATTRAYGFGEGALSTHGVGFDSLSTYFNAQFQLVGATQTYAPLQAGADVRGNVPEPPPLATWFDRSGFEPRAVYAELKDFMPQPYLEPLRVRGGELYAYGPWVIHYYGATAAWEGKILRATAYGGSLVPDYTIDPSVPVTRAGIIGSSARIDLAGLAHPVPVSLEIQQLSLTQGTNNDSTSHFQVELAVHPTRDITVLGTGRALSGRLVNGHVQIRGRSNFLSSSLVLDGTYTSGDDWRWDPSVLDPDPVAARRYLDLGPVIPHWLISARGGALIADNIDVYGRAAYSSDDGSSTLTTYTPTYFEAGGALELRLRRQIAIGASILTRQTSTDDTTSGEIIDHPNIADPIPESDSSQLGERGFTEIGTTARFTLGARKFSLLVEVYGRRTRYALDYCILETGDMCPAANDTGVQSVSFRGGGRVQIDAWIGQRLRLFASYEISSALDFEPAITGYKSLRLMMEGRY